MKLSREKKRYLKYIAIIWLLLASFTQFTRFNYSPSKSLPYRYFFTIKFQKPGKGDYASIEGHYTKLSIPTDFIKQIIGTEGDSIVLKDNQIFVSGRQVGNIISTTKFGDKLTPIDISIIPEGYVFVAGTHKRSFDSRYQEFGLVNRNSIVGKSIGFIKW